MMPELVNGWDSIPIKLCLQNQTVGQTLLLHIKASNSERKRNSVKVTGEKLASEPPLEICRKRRGREKWGKWERGENEPGRM